MSHHRTVNIRNVPPSDSQRSHCRTLGHSDTRTLGRSDTQTLRRSDTWTRGVSTVRGCCPSPVLNTGSLQCNWKRLTRARVPKLHAPITRVLSPSSIVCAHVRSMTWWAEESANVQAQTQMQALKLMHREDEASVRLGGYFYRLCMFPVSCSEFWEPF